MPPATTRAAEHRDVEQRFLSEHVRLDVTFEESRGERGDVSMWPVQMYRTGKRHLFNVT